MRAFPPVVEMMSSRKSGDAAVTIGSQTLGDKPPVAPAVCHGWVNNTPFQGAPPNRPSVATFPMDVIHHCTQSVETSVRGSRKRYQQQSRNRCIRAKCACV